MEEETWKRLKWEFPVIYLAVVGSTATNYAFTNPNYTLMQLLQVLLRVALTGLIILGILYLVIYEIYLHSNKKT